MELAPPRTRELLGVEIAVLDYAEALARIDALIEAGPPGYICHAAVNTLMNARRDPAVLGALGGATLVVPDGMPLVWALRSLGEPITDRVYGPDLMLAECERSVRTGARHFLYGGSTEGATGGLEAALRSRFPGVEVVGRRTPPFGELTPAEAASAQDAIERSRADIVWVGLGSPRQEKWMAQMRGRLGAPVLIGVGAAFDFHAGIVAQAPAWMQRSGLEWLYRLRREPRRLAGRYARDNPAFLALWARQWALERRRQSTVG